MIREQFFSRERRHLFALRQRMEAAPAEMEIRFIPVRETDLLDGGRFRTEAPFVQNGRELWWPLETNRQTTFVAMWIEGGEVQGYVRDGLHLKTHGEEEISLFLAVLSTADDGNAFEAARSIVGVAAQDGWKTLAQEHHDAWRRFWSESLIAFPAGADEAQKVWLRGNYYLGSSLNTAPARPPQATGLARVAGPPCSPRDFCLLYQNTLTANHLPLARSTRGFWKDQLPHAAAHAGRVFDLPGACYPAIPPMPEESGDCGDGVSHDSEPDLLHSAMVSRLCYDYFRYTGDLDGLREFGYPVIQAIAAMVEGVVGNPEGEGPLHLRYRTARSGEDVPPSVADPSLDPIVAAEYALRVAVRCAAVLSRDSEPAARWERLLARGFDNARLDRDGGLGARVSGEGTATAPIASSWLHPVALLPIPQLAQDCRTLNAYRRRYALAGETGVARCVAWPLGEFLLTSARYRSAEGFRRDWEGLRAHGLADDRWIQFRESIQSPRFHHLPTHGLVMESLTECAVQDWLGCIEPFAFLLPEWREGTARAPFRFENLRTQGGFLVSGVLEGRQGEVDILSSAGGSLAVKIPLDWDRGALVEFPGRRVATGEGGQILRTRTLSGRRYQLRPLRGS